MRLRWWRPEPELDGLRRVIEPTQLLAQPFMTPGQQWRSRRGQRPGGGRR